MKIVNLEIEDVAGRGVEGHLPLDGLTVLFGRNASGKTVMLESAASFLDATLAWRGRRGRIDDTDQFPYGTWYLRGDWDGADWVWLHTVMANQVEWSEEERSQGMVATEPTDPVVTDARSASRIEFVHSLAEVASPAVEDPIILGVLAELTQNMLVTYSPWPGALVDAVIDCSKISDELRQDVSDAAGLLAGTKLGERLRDIAETTEGFRTLMGLGVLDESNFDELELTPPATIHVTATEHATEDLVEAAIFASWVTGYDDETAALRPSGDGRFVVHQDIENSAREISEVLLRRPIPAFVLEQGLPEIRVPTPELWYRAGRVLVGLRTADGGFIDVRQTSAAVARWLHILTLLAIDQWLRDHMRPGQAASWTGGVPRRPDNLPRFPISGRVLVLDEPELHLHPVAQDQVADWLTALTADGCTTALVATHSSQILGAYGPLVRLIGLSRNSGKTQLNDLTADTRGALDAAAAMYGMDRSAWVQVTRGLVLVEGEHDRAVLENACGAELRRLRVTLIPIRGHKNLEGTVVSDFFGRMGIPIRVLLDDVRAAVLSGDPNVEPRSSEERAALRQLAFQRDKYPHLDVIAYDEPDIWCSLPMAAVQRAWPEARTLSWGEIVGSWEEMNPKGRQGFKSYARERLGLRKVRDDDFFFKVIGTILTEDTYSTSFTDAVDEVLGSLR